MLQSVVGLRGSAGLVVAPGAAVALARAWAVVAAPVWVAPGALVPAEVGRGRAPPGDCQERGLVTLATATAEVEALGCALGPARALAAADGSMAALAEAIGSTSPLAPLCVAAGADAAGAGGSSWVSSETSNRADATQRAAVPPST